MKKLLLILMLGILHLCGCASIYTISTQNPVPSTPPTQTKIQTLPTSIGPAPATTVPVPESSDPSSIPETDPWEAEPSFDPKSLLEQMPEDVQQQIRADYCTEVNDVTADQVSLRIFCISGDAYTMFVDAGSYAGVETQESVGNFRFCYSSAQKLIVYLNGNFYSLTEAYDMGVLSDSELWMIFQNYYNAYPHLWALYYEVDE